MLRPIAAGLLLSLAALSLTPACADSPPPCAEAVRLGLDRYVARRTRRGLDGGQRRRL